MTTNPSETATAVIERPGTARTAYPLQFIELDDRGRPWIVGTKVKVIEVVLDKLGQGWDADEIHRQLPFLSLAQIHAAFAYYYGHQAEIDAEIQADIEEVARLRAEAGESPGRKKLREMGLLP